MLSSTLLLGLSLATASLASPARRGADFLTVTVTPSAPSVESISELSFQASVHNPTDKEIKVLKYGTVLDTLPTRSFIVTKDGKEVDFSGIRVNVDSSNPDAYVTIPSGGSVYANHTLADLYDFETAGLGTYTFLPVTTFQLDSAKGQTAPGAAVSVEITKSVAKTTKPGVLLSTPSCSDAGRKQILTDTLTVARALAGGAATDVQNHPTSSQFRTYFGNNAWNTPWYNFDRIAGDLASSGTRTLSCTDPQGACQGGVVAYTLLGSSGGTIVSSNIYFCDYFFNNMNPTDTVCQGAAFSSVRGNVMVHELSHAVAQTLDTVYGCSGAAALSDAQKLTNADNYACMALQIKKDYAC